MTNLSKSIAKRLYVLILSLIISATLIGQDKRMIDDIKTHTTGTAV